MITLAIILAILWLMGVIWIPATGLVHALLVVAIIVLIVRALRNQPLL